MRRWSYAAALVLPLLYGTGVYAFWPIIVPEFARRDLWEVVMGGAEDVVAGFWYLRFVLAPVLGVLGLGHGLMPASRAVSQWWHVGISMLCGAALSVVSMGLTLHTEMAAYKSASRTVAETRVVKRMRFSRIVHYRLECHFKDALGAEHVFGITAVDEPGRPPVGYPAEVVRKLRDGASVLLVPLRYDPGKPNRAWVEGTGGIDDNATVLASVGLLAFQLMGLALFALLFLPSLRMHCREGYVPWWADIYKVMPLAIEAVFLGLFGALEVVVGRQG